MALLYGFDPSGPTPFESVASEAISLAQLAALVIRVPGDAGIALLVLLLFLTWPGPRPPKGTPERARKTVHAPKLGDRTVCDEPLAGCVVGSVLINVEDDGSESAYIEDLDGEPADECAACLAMLPRLSWEPA